LQEFLDAAIAAAREAGALIRRRLGNYSTIETKSSISDLVTDVDRASEALLADRLLNAFPGHLMLGEEGMAENGRRVSEQEDASRVEYLWVCDPIDGTTNFVYGLPLCSVSIALARWGEPVLGVIYDPVRDELFSARRGGGAFLGDRRLKVNPERRLEEALVATGFPVRAGLRQVNLEDAMRVVPRVRNLRGFGSAALHLAYVAAGRLTGFWERGLHAWDLAAGYVLVTEAGGTLTDLDGAPYRLSTADLLATNGLVHDELLNLISPAKER
jgi:myo-inositol-1(or 4)-monophosphatase